MIRVVDRQLALVLTIARWELGEKDTNHAFFNQLNVSSIETTVK
jgi:hypothetical protein